MYCAYNIEQYLTYSHVSVKTPVPIRSKELSSNVHKRNLNCCSPKHNTDPSLFLTHSNPDVFYNTTRLCWFSISSWEGLIKMKPLRITTCCISVLFRKKLLIHTCKVWINWKRGFCVRECRYFTWNNITCMLYVFFLFCFFQSRVY